MMGATNVEDGLLGIGMDAGATAKGDHKGKV